MVSDTGRRPVRQQVQGRRIEEVLGTALVEVRRVRHIDDDVGACQGVGESLARVRVDAGGTGRRDHIVPVGLQSPHESGSDESRAAYHRDPHVLALSAAPAAASTGVTGRPHDL
ncbi:hypothetical protein L2X98_23310 [Microbacterium elymi]|uniref:Uncharacterized protein n=1 Tax=Microbacterium elymi TaxID=2909587 RepID=A0ABY5NLG8_9MICO|nr:hypothetical protein [Microbacterium elymi]UUT36033.1 hypothetical protein L2X98_23310 [Microbacterium elymi]